MDVVKYGADASDFLDVHRRMEESVQRLGNTLDRAGAGGAENFLRSEFRVERQSHRLAASLFGAHDAASAAGAALRAFALSTNIGLPITIGALVAAEAISKIAEQSEKTHKAFLELREELNKPFGTQIHFAGAEIGSEMDKLEQKASGLRKELNSTTTAIVNFFKRGSPGGLRAESDFVNAGNAPTKAQLSPEQSALVESESRLKKLANAQADAELKVVDTKRHALAVSQEQGAAEKSNLDFENQSAKIIAEAAERADRFDFDRLSILSKRLSALKQERDLTIEIQRAKAEDKIAKDQAAESQFAKDVGSGKFVSQTIPQQELEEQQRAAGEALIDELRADRDKGVTLGPNAQRILNEADRLSDATKNDYSGLAALDGLQFEGLKALDGLTITIK